MSAMGTSCAGDLVGPGRDLRVVAPATELVVGGELPLSVIAGDRVLLPEQVEWLSRDPSTVTVRAGVAHGVFPGVAWVLAIRRSATDSIRLTVGFGDLTPGQAGVRHGDQLLHLTGASFMTQNTRSLTYSTAILATSGGIIDLPGGVCCQLRGDTTLQLNYLGAPVVGSRMLLPADVRIETRVTQMLVHTGPDDLLLMVKDDGLRMRFYFPVRPTTLELREVVLPTPTTTGRVRGRVSFEAAGILQVSDGLGNFTYSPIGDRTTMLYTEFDTPLHYRTFTPPFPP
jgi:hypothetical protein